MRIEHPRASTTTTTNSNCSVPIVGRAYNTGPGWRVRVEVFTNQWYLQNKWYADGLAPIVDGMWATPEIFLGGTGLYNNRGVRAQLLDAGNNVVASGEISGIVRANTCTP